MHQQKHIEITAYLKKNIDGSFTRTKLESTTLDEELPSEIMYGAFEQTGKGEPIAISCDTSISSIMSSLPPALMSANSMPYTLMLTLIAPDAISRQQAQESFDLFYSNIAEIVQVRPPEHETKNLSVS